MGISEDHPCDSQVREVRGRKNHDTLKGETEEMVSR